MRNYTIEEVLQAQAEIEKNIRAVRELVNSMDPEVEIARPPNWPPVGIAPLVADCQTPAREDVDDWRELETYTKVHLTIALEQIEWYVRSVSKVLSWMDPDTDIVGVANGQEPLAGSCSLPDVEPPEEEAV